MNARYIAPKHIMIKVIPIRLFNLWKLKCRHVLWALILLTVAATSYADQTGTLAEPANSLAKQTRVLIVGDSLSASYGIPTENSWAVLLEESYQSSEHSADIINASISGETTGGARQRLPQLLTSHQPDITIIELGGNDGLRGFPLKVIKNNLEQMIKLALEHDSQPILVGMRIPPNYGPQYTEGFFNLFQELATQYNLPLIPFFLDGIALDSSLMQNDGIHPNAQAQPLLLAKIREVLDPVLANIN
ncbi:arylesterase [Hahella ganghwensis]|uniref:arylesterase n=1 Tax=Hahella ganghwensis TaxID=286420 RepID=UPI000367CD8D|nr:arylesterase [Hahella ganghwensis]